LDSSLLGARSHSATVDPTTSRIALSNGDNTVFVWNGIFMAMYRGRNTRCGILSLVSISPKVHHPASAFSCPLRGRELMAPCWLVVVLDTSIFIEIESN
jgi:hypothetical protein